ncbi:S8 family peptidase [Micromonospora rubida]|uniref:S8 family peptidase n=1 Tax=Micromonospora rubida TaxID=2697657 RepID=UPI001376620B|nr:S8 family peptidase [Micromonospora rubida]NBE82917.1 S8 family serine peptidase [Micromonospora rubida]
MRLRHRAISTHTRRPGLAAMAVLATTTLAAAMLAGPASPAAAAGPASGAIGEILGAGSATAVPGSYIVTLKESAVGDRTTVSGVVGGLAGRYGVNPDQVWGDALNGFSVRTSEAVARRLAADRAVAHVEQDRLTTLATTQQNAPWNLDRIDAPLGLSGTYSYASQGTGVRAYIVDSGINIAHQNFGGQAIYGYDAVDGMLPADDCSGHGTHAAGTVGGTTYGVAKDVVLVAVKVFDCVLPSTLSILISGINWMVVDHQAGQPAVANIGIQSTLNNALNTAVANAVADGITVTVPAGNSNANACNFSPGSVPTVLTVAATQSNDSRASFSNYGPCVDIFAPGVGIMSTWINSTTAVQSLSGTSHAAPHVAGAAARVLSNYPTWTPAQVTSFLFGVANPAVLNPGAGSPNWLLYLAPTF